LFLERRFDDIGKWEEGNSLWYIARLLN
jgi:hypothetical protein